MRMEEFSRAERRWARRRVFGQRRRRPWGKLALVVLIGIGAYAIARTNQLPAFADLWSGTFAPAIPSQPQQASLLPLPAQPAGGR